MRDTTHRGIDFYMELVRSDVRIAAAQQAESHAEFRADIKSGITALSTDIAHLRSGISASFSDQTRWIAVMALNAIVVIAVLCNAFEPTPRPTSAAPPAAIYVIYAYR